MYKGLPHLQLSPNAGGAVAKLTERIIKKLDDEEKKMGVPLATEQSDTWAARVVPRFSFDKNSPHPNAQKKPSPAAVSTTSTKSTAISTTPANDNVSINSGSTLANGPSGQTVVSQDFSSVVSQLQSQAMEQSKMFKEMMDKQDKRDRRAARVQKKMMTMIMTMMQNNQGSKKSNKKKKKSQQNRTKITRKKDSFSYHQRDVEEHDITSADDDLGSAGGNRYGDQGESGPFFDEDNEANMDANSWDEEDQDDTGSDDDEDSSSRGDDDSGSDSDSSSDESNDKKSTKTEATNNRPKKKNNDPSIRLAPVQKQNSTTDQNNEAVNINREELKNEILSVTKESEKQSIFMRQRKRLPIANLTKEEALAHTKLRMEASQQEQLERDKRKRQMGIPLDLMITNSDDETMTPPKARSRLRSPGNTPENKDKMQRTSTAPTQPSTQDELASALCRKGRPFRYFLM
jgi:hypothetical protein